jgi:hypothetical protein
VLRRTFAAVAAVAALAALAPTVALAARVTIRVEGRTQTLFAPVPRVVEAATPLEALERASVAGEFYYHVAEASFGRYVDQIGRYAAAGSSGWVFKVNDASPPVGADAVQLKEGDSVLWYHAEFGPAGGPPTLRLAATSRRARGARCYRVTAFADAGTGRPAAFATLRVDGRRIRTTRLGVGCPGRHSGLVRATLAGAIRSNAAR